MTAFNPWRTALELTDFDLLAFVRSGKANYRQSILAILIDHGKPLTLAEIASRLQALGMGETEASLLRSLRKAWGGCDALRMLDDGRLWLDTSMPDAEDFATDRRVSTLPPPPPYTPLSTAPITLADLDQLPKGTSMHGLNGARLAAVVTEAMGRSMLAKEINDFLDVRGFQFHPLQDPPSATARSKFVLADENYRLEVNPNADGLPALRQDIRKRMERAGVLAVIDEYTAQSDRERKVRQMEVLARRRRLVHAFFDKNVPILVGHWDPADTGPPTFVPATSLRDASWLPDSDILIGADIFGLLNHLHIELDSRRYVDLLPRQKTIGMGPGRPRLKLTLDRVLRNTLGSWAHLSPATTIRALAKNDDLTSLEQRMHADLDTLTTFYWYGVRQRIIDPIWRDDAAFLRVAFGERDDRDMSQIVEDAIGTTVWIRLRGEKMSDQPEEFVGTLTSLRWYAFTLNSLTVAVRADIRDIIEINRVEANG